MRIKTKDDVKDKVLSFLACEFDIESTTIQESDVLAERFFKDSLDLIETVIRLEDEFEIVILAAEEEKFKTMTVGELIDFIVEKINL